MTLIIVNEELTIVVLSVGVVEIAQVAIVEIGSDLDEDEVESRGSELEGAALSPHQPRYPPPHVVETWETRRAPTRRPSESASEEEPPEHVGRGRTERSVSARIVAESVDLGP